MADPKKNDDYGDIIHLPHHESKSHPRMTLYNRAAQFSPFAALTGYDDAVREVQRLTHEEMELSEDRKAELDKCFWQAIAPGAPAAEITVTYFVRDAKKEGGSYVTKTGKIRRVDEKQRLLIFEDGERIEMDHITEISSVFLS